jgi:hypothetical protein
VVVHGDVIRNLGSSVISGQNGKATTQQQGQRADGGFVGGKEPPIQTTPVSFIVFICFVFHHYPFQFFYFLL